MAAKNGSQPIIMAFLKAPRPGSVKTRLGRQIGHEQATKLYRALAERQMKSAPSAFRVEVHYAPRGAATEMREWLGPDYRYRAQSSGNLGRRLAEAFARGFKHEATAIIAIGADCPTLDGECLSEAAQCLGQTDVVLGPARDGGYYLIGLRRPAPQLFTDIAWSSERVLPQTLARVKASGLSVHLLPIREDIDDWESLRRYVQNDPSFAFAQSERSAMKKAGR